MISSTAATHHVIPINFRYLAIAGAAIWLLFLVAGISAYIYGEIDGPNVRSLISENLALRENLNTVQIEAANTKDQLSIANTRNSYLNTLLTRSMVDSERTRSILREMNSASPPSR